jgi:hypothetical protein
MIHFCVRFRIVPNAEHYLVGHIVDIIHSIEAFYLSILTVSKY